jgi:glycine cleavage system transcriptional repressor
MEQLLIINAVGTYQPRILSRLARSVRDCGATISDCRMDLLGNEVSISMLISGSWDAIAKLEGSFSKLEQELDIRMIGKRTGARLPERQRLPYSIEIISGNKSDVISEVTEFLQKNDINICEFYTNTYQNPHTDIAMLAIHMTVVIPSSNSISILRSEFLDFCDRLNLDAILEPSK